jgi:DNA-binding CsgD family transcriptional regulator
MAASDIGGPPPLIVVEGDPGSVARLQARLRSSGLELVAGFGEPARRTGIVARPGAVVRFGVVADPSDAAEALLAAIDGSGLLVDATAEREVVDRLVDDLRRVGPVDHRVGAGGPDDPEPGLSPEARAILGLLAEGHSLGEAAAILGLSRRTADRRLDAARRALGVTRTTEAIARASRLGLLGGDDA